MSNEQLYLVLGCFGRKDSTDNSNTPLFVSCAGVENRILKVDNSLDSVDEMMDYFEAVRLFDKPMFDVNATRHFIQNMQDRYDQKLKRLWSEKYYNLLERFVVSHRACGTYVKLILVNTEFDAPPEKEPEKILIKGQPEIITPIGKPPELRVIRGR